jgi:endonuclease G
MASEQFERILADEELAAEIAERVPLLRGPGEIRTATGRGALDGERGFGGRRALATARARRAAPAAARAAVERATEGRPFNEAIVLRFGRPSLLVTNDSFEVPPSDTWKARLYPYRSKIEKAIRAVARVEVIGHSLDYLGTAWVVAPNCAITNRHVAVEFAQKRGARFVYRKNPLGEEYRAVLDFKEEQIPTLPIAFEVSDILYIADLDDRFPDLAFLKVAPAPGRVLPPPIPLFEGRLQREQMVAVIGYPAFDDRNDRSDMARIFQNIYDVKRLAPGYVQHEELDSMTFSHDCTTLGGSSGSVVIDVETGAAVGLHFSGLYLDANYAVPAKILREYLEKTKVKLPPVPPEPPALESFTVSAAQMQGRKGYQTDFLGAGKYTVPLPGVSDNPFGKAVEVDRRADGIERYLLHYTHFSVVMNADRGLAFYTASNIDGSLSRRIKRKKDVWGFDPRIDARHQHGNDLYQGNDLDRGHLVRRLDPAWGNEEEASQAEKDTFFFTNCSPQMAGFNQEIWLELEDYILNNADTRDFKACVFTGPAFSDQDRHYRGARLPLAFWKVVAMRHAEQAQLTATAYVVSQADLLTRLEFIFGQFKTYQVPIARIETMTGLDFGDLKKVDPLRRQEALMARELLALDQILL